MNRWMKLMLVIVVVGGFLATLPGVFQNHSDYKRLEGEVKTQLRLIDKICDSGCKDYPKEWVMEGFELEAENYCLRQCMDRGNMKAQLIETYLPIEYTSQYNYRVMQLYCLLGLFCPPLELQKMR